MRANWLGFMAVLALSWGAMAATIEQPLPDAAEEARARALFAQFRCVVCEGQSLAESDALLATQMRALIRDKIAEGQTDAQITDGFRQSYGEHILMEPPMNGAGVLLWLAPLLFLSVGGALLWRLTRTKGTL